MHFRDWFRPPRHLIALFLLTTLVPSVALMAFGWRLLLQDRALEMQRVDDQREQAADLVVAMLQQLLDRAQQRIQEPDASSMAAPGAMVVTFRGERVEAAWPTPVFYPVAPPVPDAAALSFVTGEALEFRHENLRRAAAWYRDQTTSADPSIRAGAWIRVARTMRKLRDIDGALGAYAALAEVDNAAVDGVPASLLAQWARCDLLAKLGRHAELQRAAAALHADLSTGRWPIDRATYDVHMTDARQWLGGAAPPPSDGERFAIAADVIWRRWRDSRGDGTSSWPRSGRESIPVYDDRLVAIWEGDATRLQALIAGPGYVQREWIAGLEPILARHHVQVDLRDRVSKTANAPESWRAAADTLLPWTVVVRSTGSNPQLSLLAGRRAMWFAAVAILGTLVLAGAFFVSRAATRELAVARRQSDFVAAVSHEFRTPLTTLRQLTETLADGRVASEERRLAYYAALGRQTSRLHRLVEGLLEFARAESGQAPFRFERIDANAIVRAAVDQFSAELADRGRAIELAVSGDMAIVLADPEALTSALWNLLDNAVKYSPGCPTIWVDVDCTPAQVAITVRDRGFGIPPREQRAIFSKFVRGAVATSENIKGTGIGLAMVRHIMEAHQGTVTVVSEPGAGSAFTLTLPNCREVST